MTIDEKDFQSFITVKQNLDTSSVHNCMIRFRVIKRWLDENELTKENVERFFYELRIEKKRKNT